MDCPSGLRRGSSRNVGNTAGRVRPWSLLPVLGLLLLVSGLGYVLWCGSSIRQVSLEKAGEVCRLEFPPNTGLLHSAYSDFVKPALVAQVSMPQADLRRFAEMNALIFSPCQSGLRNMEQDTTEVRNIFGIRAEWWTPSGGSGCLVAHRYRGLALRGRGGNSEYGAANEAEPIVGPSLPSDGYEMDRLAVVTENRESNVLVYLYLYTD